MDEKQYGEYDLESVRERIQSKRDEFADGPTPGWEKMEEAATSSRPASMTSGQSDASGDSLMPGSYDDVTPSAMERGTSTHIPMAGTAASDAPVADEEHPLGVGRQCTMCGTYNDLEATTCRNCSEPLGTDMGAAAARPVSPVSENDE